MTVQNPIPKQILRPIKTGTNSAINKSGFLEITCNFAQGAGKIAHTSCDWFCFSLLVHHWSRIWRETLSQSQSVASKIAQLLYYMGKTDLYLSSKDHSYYSPFFSRKKTTVVIYQSPIWPWKCFFAGEPITTSWVWFCLALWLLAPSSLSLSFQQNLVKE